MDSAVLRRGSELANAGGGRTCGAREARDARLGLAAGAGRAVTFRKGRKAGIAEEADMLTALMEEIRAVAEGSAAP